MTRNGDSEIKPDGATEMGVRTILGGALRVLWQNRLLFLVAIMVPAIIRVLAEPRVLALVPAGSEEQKQLVAFSMKWALVSGVALLWGPVQLSAAVAATVTAEGGRVSLAQVLRGAWMLAVFHAAVYLPFGIGMIFIVPGLISFVVLPVFLDPVARFRGTGWIYDSAVAKGVGTRALAALALMALVGPPWVAVGLLGLLPLGQHWLFQFLSGLSMELLTVFCMLCFAAGHAQGTRVAKSDG
jgi:hypothetical protein